MFPGIAVTESLKEMDPRGEVLFIGSDRGLEREILLREGIPQEVLSVGRIKGEGWGERLRTVIKLPQAVIQARKILMRFLPDVVLGIGGYSSGPVILAAWIAKIPRAILEPNTIPGFTNRILGRFVHLVFIAFPEGLRFFPKKKVRMTGTPVRKKLSPRKIVPEGGRPFIVLVIGGSQGATALNRAMVGLLTQLEKSERKFRIIHQTGGNDLGWVREAYASTRIPHEVRAFIEDMSLAYRDADLMICRAGASTLAEMIETRTPAILVPYPYAADDHQKYNALSLVRAGGGEMILNQDLEGRLAERILFYDANRAELEKMREKLGRIREEPAAVAVARECLELCNVPKS